MQCFAVLLKAMRRIKSCPQIAERAPCVPTYPPKSMPRNVSAGSGLDALANAMIVEPMQTEAVVHVPHVVMELCRLQHPFPEDILHAADLPQDLVEDIAICLQTPWDTYKDDAPLELPKELQLRRLAYLAECEKNSVLQERYMNLMRRLRRNKQKSPSS